MSLAETMAKFGHAFRLDTGHPSGIKERIYAAAVERKEKRDQQGTFFWEARIVGKRVTAKRVVRYLMERPACIPTHKYKTEPHRVKLSCGWEQVEAWTVGFNDPKWLWVAFYETEHNGYSAFLRTTGQVIITGEESVASVIDAFSSISRKTNILKWNKQRK